jgi:hypothetical protein
MKAGLVLPPAADVIAEMERAVNGGRLDGPVWAALLGDLVESNMRQWDLEDLTRDPWASDAVVANAKREIDRLNTGRHRLVEQIDAVIDSSLDQATSAPIATESPGMVLDRLSVLIIRRARTAAASRRDAAYAARGAALDAQLAALSAALDSYMDELRAGTRRFFRYQSLKLYGPA